MIDKIERVALRSSAPVLLTGPTGAGNHSRHGGFMNCAAAAIR